MNELPKRRRSLTNEAFFVLTALAFGEQLASEIQKQIVADTTGVYVGSGSLHMVLTRFAEMDWVVKDRKYYKLTEEGWRRLRLETRTLDAVVTHSKRRVVQSGHGRW